LRRLRRKPGRKRAGAHRLRHLLPAGGSSRQRLRWLGHPGRRRDSAAHPVPGHSQRTSRGCLGGLRLEVAPGFALHGLGWRPGATAPGPLGNDATLALQVAGSGGVPAAGASAVVLNVTAVTPSGSGFLTVYPSGTPRPNTSNLNWVPGKTVPNLVETPIGPDGKV